MQYVGGRVLAEDIFSKGIAGHDCNAGGHSGLSIKEGEFAFPETFQLYATFITFQSPYVTGR